MPFCTATVSSSTAVSTIAPHKIQKKASPTSESKFAIRAPSKAGKQQSLCKRYSQVIEKHFKFHYSSARFTDHEEYAAKVELVTEKLAAFKITPPKKVEKDVKLFQAATVKTNEKKKENKVVFSFTAPADAPRFAYKRSAPKDDLAPISSFNDKIVNKEKKQMERRDQKENNNLFAGALAQVQQTALPPKAVERPDYSKYTIVKRVKPNVPSV